MGKKLKNAVAFSSFSKKVTEILGSFWCFLIACMGTIVWLLIGPIYNFSSTWQLVINTITTIITFLMVFLIQHSQNRDVMMLNIKLDELIRANKQADNHSIDLSKLSDKELEILEKEYIKLCKKSD